MNKEQTNIALSECLKKAEALRAQGKTIYPAQENILKALELTPPDKARVVILGQDPYHGPGQAMGLSFSVPDGVKVPPSLRNIFEELRREGYLEGLPKSGNLTSWARQGVLLLNVVLTVEEGKPGSHRDLGWQEVTGSIIQNILDSGRPVVFLLWGKDAAKTYEEAAAKSCSAKGAFPIYTTHPSPFSARRAAGETPAFLGSGCFKEANRFLREAGSEEIDWGL